MENIFNTMDVRYLREFAYFMSGSRLGIGMSRQVFECPWDASMVLKVEYTNGHFQNVREWENWQYFSHYEPVAKWLAPCHRISDDGNFLLQSKALDLRPDEIPEKLPAFLTDHKCDNLGIIGSGKAKRLVCRDYSGMIMNAQNGMKKFWSDSNA